MSEILIRNASYEEMALIIELAEREGWNSGLSDNDFYFRADPNGFILLLRDHQLLGSISSVEFGTDFGFIGFHIVQEEFRKKGFGKKLLNVAVERLGDRNIGLNCFEHQKEYYESAGFEPAHKIYSYKGISNGKLNKPDYIVSPFLHPFEFLHKLDKKHFPTDRKDFLTNWLNQPQSLLLAKLVDGKYDGFGLIRPGSGSYKIAPLFSDDLNSAEEILTSLIGHFPEGSEYSIEIPESNSDGIKLAEKMNMKKINTIIRMYSKTIPDIALDGIYGFSSFELG